MITWIRKLKPYSHFVKFQTKFQKFMSNMGRAFFGFFWNSTMAFLCFLILNHLCIFDYLYRKGIINWIVLVTSNGNINQSRVHSWYLTYQTAFCPSRYDFSSINDAKRLVPFAEVIAHDQYIMLSIHRRFVHGSDDRLVVERHRKLLFAANIDRFAYLERHKVAEIWGDALIYTMAN